MRLVENFLTSCDRRCGQIVTTVTDVTYFLWANFDFCLFGILSSCLLSKCQGVGPAERRESGSRRKWDGWGAVTHNRSSHQDEFSTVHTLSVGARRSSHQPAVVAIPKNKMFVLPISDWLSGWEHRWGGRLRGFTNTHHLSIHASKENTEITHLKRRAGKTQHKNHNTCGENE